MPRRARHYLAGMPYHIVQRGNNRQICFREPDDYRCYLNLWRKVSAYYGVFVHAYCLMTNHIHFLVTTSRQEGISNTTRVVGSRYAAYVNAKYERTGTLWEGRHRASLVQTARYFLTCQRYIELNPVRAKMVECPEQYPWSSFVENAFGYDGEGYDGEGYDREGRDGEGYDGEGRDGLDNDGWLTPHEDFLALGDTETERRRTYLEMFARSISPEDLKLIRSATHFCQPTADEDFKNELKTRYGLKIGHMRRGRPRRVLEDAKDVAKGS